MVVELRGTIVSLSTDPNGDLLGVVALDAEENHWRSFKEADLDRRGGVEPADLRVGDRVYCWRSGDQIGVSKTPLTEGR
jgi:hypothetical protein